jgi:hypothetical protein
MTGGVNKVQLYQMLEVMEIRRMCNPSLSHKSNQGSPEELFPTGILDIVSTPAVV